MTNIPDKPYSSFTEEEKSQHPIDSLLWKSEAPDLGPLWVNFKETERGFLGTQVPASRRYAITNFSDGSSATKWFPFGEAMSIAKELNVKLEEC